MSLPLETLNYFLDSPLWGWSCFEQVLAEIVAYFEFVLVLVKIDLLIERYQFRIGISIHLMFLVEGNLHPECEVIHCSGQWTVHWLDRIFACNHIVEFTKLGQRYVLSDIAQLSLPMLGFIEQIPQYSAGILRLPPISLPIPIGLQRAAIRPASPPELPPTLRSLFQILRDRPHNRLLL